MRRKISILLLLFLAGYSSFSQSYTNTIKEKSLVKGQTIYLNSKARLGGKNRIVIPVVLPANTISWYYSFASVTTENKNQQLASSGLEYQIAKLISNGVLTVIGAGLTTNIVSQLVKPTGNGSVDIYLTDSDGLKQFERSDIPGIYNYNVPAFFREGTVQNGKNGVFQIPLVRKDLYLCLRNPSITEGVAVSVDIVAIVSDKEYKDVWTAKNTQALYETCLNTPGEKTADKEKVCDCVRTQIKDTFVPSAYVNLSKDEKDKILRSTIETCTKQSASVTADRSEKIKEITQLIEAQTLTREYSDLITSYNHLLALGVNDWKVYNGLAFSQLCLGQFPEAKKNLTAGLSKNPDQLMLLANLANYYILTNQYDLAFKIFDQYKSKKRDDKRRVKEAVADDLKEFERLGLSNSNFSRLRNELKIK